MFDKFTALLFEEYVIAPAVIVFFSLATYFITRSFLLPVLHRLICQKNEDWRSIFDKHKPFKQISFLAPTIFIYFGLHYFPNFEAYLERVLNFYITINIMFMLNSILNTFLHIYNLYPIAKDRPIKSYTQMGGIFIYIVGSVIATCQLLDKDVWAFVTAIGGLTAVIILVFRDTILSFIAGIQILSNNLIRKGDWIEVKSFGADGAVIDVALHVIKVQNFDKTVVTIPTYKVIESGFKNWRGMYDSGGRRIKRSVIIDQTSVSFMNKDRLKVLEKNPHIKKYMEDFLNSIETTAAESDAELWEVTNLGVFRKYVEAYLRAHPKINQNLSFLIRLLDPTPTGIPLEIYIFTKDTEWAKHEEVQAEIFEHFMAVLPIFGLHIYQRPGGYDIEQFHENSQRQKVLRKYA